MNIKNLLEEQSIDNFPSGLGGCKGKNQSSDYCEYDITIFDNKKADPSVIEYENELVKLHHGSLYEIDSNTLIRYYDMQIIFDEQWELQMLLSKINEKKEAIFYDYAKSCLIDTLFCVSKTKDGLNSDPFASLWLKCGAYFLADAISGFNFQRPSPTHMLEYIRTLEKNQTNEKFAVVNDCIGIERATPSLLLRMCKSTIGFSEMIETNNNYSKTIQIKHDYLVKNGLLSDCYFYLNYINRNNVLRIKDVLQQKPEFIHILKVGFDIENNASKVEQQANLLQKAANELLSFYTKTLYD